MRLPTSLVGALFLWVGHLLLSSEVVGIGTQFQNKVGLKQTLRICLLRSLGSEEISLRRTKKRAFYSVQEFCSDLLDLVIRKELNRYDSSELPSDLLSLHIAIGNQMPS